MKPGCHLAQSPIEDHGSKRAVLRMMMIMMKHTSVAWVIGYPEVDSKGF
jgi:hypothetical protein